MGGNRMQNPMQREQDRSRFNRAQNPGMGGARSRPNGFGDGAQNGSRYGGGSRIQNGDGGARDRSRSRQGSKDYGNGRDYGRSAVSSAAGNGRPSRFDAPPPSMGSSVRENGRFSRFSDNKPPPSAEDNGWNSANAGSYNGSNSSSTSTTHVRREGGSRFSAAAPHTKAYQTNGQGGAPRPLMSLN